MVFVVVIVIGVLVVLENMGFVLFMWLFDRVWFEYIDNEGFCGFIYRVFEWMKFFLSMFDIIRFIF